MIESVTGAVSALRGALAMAKTAIEYRDDKKISEAMTSINDKIIAVQDACMRLQETNSTLLQDKHTLANEKRELEKQIADLREKTDRLAKYELQQPYPGTFVFGLKQTVGNEEPMHYACPTCLEIRGVISRLQHGATYGYTSCSECGNTYQVADDGEMNGYA